MCALSNLLPCVTIDPAVIYRHSKAEPVRWTQRRRQFLNNPYFSSPALWKNAYDKKFNVVGTL